MRILNKKTLHRLEIAMFPQLATLFRRLGAFIVKIVEIAFV